MFGIGKMKQQITALETEVMQLLNREHTNRATVTKLVKNVGDLYRTVGEMAVAVTSTRADELAVAIAKCSTDMAELDRRLCNIESALVGTKAQREFSDEPIKAARPTPEHLNGDPAQQPLELSRKKKYVQRIESATVAATIVAIDKDAARIVEGLKRRGVHKRVIDACIAAGVVDATRNKRDIVVREKRRHGNRRYYNASVRCYGDHSRDIGFVTSLEANHCMREMQLVVSYVAEYFATGMAFDEGKPTGGKP